LKAIGFGFIGAIFSLWPLALIIIGVVLLLDKKPKQDQTSTQRFLPFVLMGLGGLAILNRFHILNFGIGVLIGPLVLLYFGVRLLRSGNGEQRQDLGSSSTAMNAYRPPNISGDSASFQASSQSSTDSGHQEKIDVFCLLSGSNFNTRSQNLGSGSVISLLGGADIDIREADTQEPLKLEVFALMGGIELRVPAHWQVTVNVMPLLGGISNKTTCLADKMNLPRKQLIVTGFVLMGGLEICN
jgi:hypothetical protein